MANIAEIKLDNKTYELPVVVGSEGEKAIDIDAIAATAADNCSTSANLAVDTLLLTQVLKIQGLLKVRSLSSMEKMESSVTGVIQLSSWLKSLTFWKCPIF